MTSVNARAISAAALDDAGRHAELDQGGMHDAIASFPSHLRESISFASRIDWTTAKPTTPAGICLCGMGGSAIGGDLARLYWAIQSPIPFVVHRGYRLPAHINDHWFVIASSYSGNTEETLASVAEARARGCRRILTISSGGSLARQSAEHSWPHILVPAGLMPRAALGYLFGSVLLTLAHWGVSGNDPRKLVAITETELRDAADLLDQRCRLLERSVSVAKNPAKRGALGVAGRVILVWGATGSTDVIAARLKSQLCENGKAMAFASPLPELCHNEIVGLTEWGGAAESAAVIVLTSDDDDPGVAHQRAAVLDQLSARRIPVIHVAAVGNSRLVRMLSLVQFGDFLSYYVAIASGIDPTPIPAIDKLKQALARS